MAPRKKKTAEPVETPAPVVAPEPVITSIKGFNSDWTCRGMKFEIGQTYEVGGAIKACINGFHACPTDQHPLSVFEFYAPADARFAEVMQSGATDKDGTKLASAKITIGVEISISDLVARAVKWVWDRATLIEAASATGRSGAASATGERGAASATGERGAASATGWRGAASATGERGAASATGKHSVALSIGHEARAMATETNAICLVYRGPRDGSIKHIRASKVGENGVKAGVWYSLNEDGEFVEVTP